MARLTTFSKVLVAFFGMLLIGAIAIIGRLAYWILFVL